MGGIEVAEGLGRLFYLVSPKATTFLHEADVPKYVEMAVPFFISFLVVELIFYTLTDNRKALKRHDGKWDQGKMRMNDLIGSLASGSLMQMSKFFLASIQMWTYNYVWDHYRIEPLAFDQFKFHTWFLCFLGTDLAYYWFHRMAHEVNLFWAAHSVHHSSEYYNIATALRQSVLQTYTSWIFNLPLALVFSPAQFAVHTQLNLLYQFWIHTETVPRLGWIEYIFNTPSAHRVHHGRNTYCIDKNYAGTLIIWDRMFGTYADEKLYPDVVTTPQEAEPVAYGLTHPINTFDPVQTQIGHFRHIFRTVLITPGLANKLKVMFYGPGWHEGTPRTGLLSEIPVVDIKNPPVKYDPKLPGRFNAYVAVHFLLIMGPSSVLLAEGHKYLPLWQTQLISAWFLYSLLGMSKVMDAKPWGLKADLARCLSLFLAAEFVARSGFVQQTAEEKSMTLRFADVNFASSLFLGWNVYQFGDRWVTLGNKEDEKKAKKQQ